MIIFERDIFSDDIESYFFVNSTMMHDFLIPNLSNTDKQLLSNQGFVSIRTFDPQKKHFYKFFFYDSDGNCGENKEGWLQFKEHRRIKLTDHIKFFFSHNPYEIRVTITVEVQNFPKQPRSSMIKLYDGLNADESIAVDALLLLSKKVVDFGPRSSGKQNDNFDRISGSNNCSSHDLTCTCNEMILREPLSGLKNLPCKTCLFCFKADMTLIENKVPSVKVQSEDVDLDESIMVNKSPSCKIDETTEGLRNIDSFSGNSFLKKFEVEDRGLASRLFHQWAKKKAFQDPKRLFEKDFQGYNVENHLLSSETINLISCKRTRQASDEGFAAIWILFACAAVLINMPSLKWKFQQDLQGNNVENILLSSEMLISLKQTRQKQKQQQHNSSRCGDITRARASDEGLHASKISLSSPCAV